MKPSPERLTVLVADDATFVLGLLEFALPLAGFRLLTARSGPQAVDVFLEHRSGIDLVLLDVHMPGLDGPEVLEVLRQVNPAVRCCFMSDGSACYDVGDLLGQASAFMPKPFAVEKLVDVLKGLAGAGSRRDAAAGV
jgi:CheY-like chemotaxis protein